MNKYFYLCVALFCHLACTSSETKISEDWNRIVITSGGYVLTTHTVADVDQAYLLVESGRPEGRTAADASIKCIPLDKAESLGKRLVDFTVGGNPLTEDVLSNAVDIQLIITDSSCTKALRKARDYCEARGFPVIRITGRELRVDHVLFRDTPVQLGGVSEGIMLADSITLEQERYSF
ncbi:MAG TPA: hypothetical protein PLJ30_14030 [Deltaproteobacteria bacterium]|jgi:hypothetical protein|nr:hypothetical protein [Deltaproteobacteria bacterium]MDI9541470.1 hypothetical protein [Pseudomonadota bacterium]HRR21913.1 hypothetical protein [Desulfomonilia bacterium]HNR51958.1 hypothetical protein [Deltaproteobacteria bacterium]HOE73571.1 hypothetical protein [Deltaproteobacteria bacterium]